MLAAVVPAWLAAFAWRFADERLYADSGYYLMRVLNEGAFRIEHGRWALALPQALPLLAARLGMPLAPIILVHSLGNALWLMAGMLLAWRGLRAPDAALALACLQVAGLAHGLFCPIFELYYGAGLLVLFIAAWRARHLGAPWRAALLVVLFLAVISSHPLALALMAWSLLMERAWRERGLFIALCAVGAAWLLHHALTLTAYEKDHLAALGRVSEPGAASALLSMGFLRAWLAHAWRHSPDAVLLGAMALALLLAARRWREAGLLIAFIAVEQAAVAVKLPAFMHDRYREQMDFPVAAAVVIALLLHSAPKGWQRLHVPAALLLAVAFRVARAEQVAPMYAARTAQIERWVDWARELGLAKALVKPTGGFGRDGHVVELAWSVPVESLLLSSAQGPRGTASIITADDAEAPGALERADAFVLRRWDVLPISWLQPRWFGLPHGARYEPLPGGP